MIEKGTTNKMELDKLKEVIASVLCVDTREIGLDTTFMGDLGADSLDVYQIVLEIEREFDIKITAEEAEKVHNVSEALELIQRFVNDSEM